MITIRSLLPESFTASWIAVYPHSAASFSFSFKSFTARFAFSFFSGMLGRSEKPFF